MSAKKVFWGKSVILLIFGAGFLLIIVLGLAFNRIKKIIGDSFDNKVLVFNDKEPFTITYDNIDISLVKQSFSLKEVLLLPDSLDLGEGKLNPHAYIQSIEVNDFEVIPLLINKSLEIDLFEVNGLEVVYKKGGTLDSQLVHKPQKSDGQKSEIGLKQLSISNFKIAEYQIIHLDKAGRDTINSLKGDLLSISNIQFNTNSEESTISINTNDLLLELKNQKVSYGSINENISLSNGVIDLGTGYLKLEDIKLNDLKRLKLKASKSNFTSTQSAFDLSKVEVFGLKTSDFFSDMSFFADSVLVNNADFTIFKDNDKPWNKNKTILLPPSMLRNEGKQIWIDKIRIQNSNLNYISQINSKEIKIPIENLEAIVSNYGTLKNRFDEFPDKALNFDFYGNAFHDINFAINLKFQEPLNSNYFSFHGKTGSFNFESFNSIMVPSSSIKFESGTVYEIDFSGYGNELSTEGELLMRYEDLVATVLKRHQVNQKNNTFSWLAKAAVRKDNPKNGKLKVAKMGFKRVPYKGFGNYFMKTIESGLMNSVYPFGARKKL